jgi:dienelactone hydrolase
MGSLSRAVLMPLVPACLALAACAGAVDAVPPCTKSFAWEGTSKSRSVSVHSAKRKTSYSASLFRPANQHRFPGRRPVVVVLRAGCGLSWAARDLAGHGYVVLVLNQAGQGSDWRTDMDALRGAMRFLGSKGNPYRHSTNPHRIGLTGWSAATGAVSLMQGQDHRVRAIVAMDDLVRVFGKHLPGGAATVHPRVPGLGLASEHEYPNSTDRDRMKKGGYSAWRAAKVPSMEVVLRGMVHGDFTSSGTEAQRRRAAHYVRAWFDRWLAGHRSATKRLLARRVLDQPLSQILSTYYRSAAYLPGRLTTPDLLARLRAH